MKIKSIEAIITSLNNEKIKYLVAGGLAVVAHGYLRFTADLDMILWLEENNLKKAIRVFKELGYKPRPPVPIESFINQASREKWVKEKGLKVFSLWSNQHPTTEIDLFIEEPIPFKDAFERATHFEIFPNIEAFVLSFEDLIYLKQSAARKKDLDDIENLMLIKQEKNNG